MFWRHVGLSKLILNPNLVTTDPKSNVLLNKKTGERYEINEDIRGVLREFRTLANPKKIAQTISKHEKNAYDNILSFINELKEIGLLVGSEHLSDTRKNIDPSLSLIERPMFTMFACPSCDLSMINELDVVFVGSTFDQGTTGFPGARFAPDKLREISSQGFEYHADPISGKCLGWYNHEVKRNILEGVSMGDVGNILQEIGEDYDKYYQRFTKVIASITEAGAFPVIIGGDHSISYPAIKGLNQHDVSVLHIDAHTDLGEYKTGIPNNHGNVFSRVIEENLIDELHQFGIRSFAGKTPKISSKYTISSVSDIRENKIDNVLDLLNLTKKYYLSIDIDAIDPAFAPGTGTPVPNGLSTDEVLKLVSRLCEKRCFVGFDIVEINPMIDQNDMTSILAIELISHVLGEIFAYP